MHGIIITLLSIFLSLCNAADIVLDKVTLPGRKFLPLGRRINLLGRKVRLYDAYSKIMSSNYLPSCLELHSEGQFRAVAI